ncbi:hypothetical protein [Streptomyces sp. NPDC059949]|uniref:hypothetical protein n=1 Tax=Streptomyces sp. NPDC059949 TaxID=3347013 RepID=UPI0036467A75
MEALDRPPADTPAPSFTLDEIQHLLHRLESWMPTFFAALGATSKGDEGAADLTRSAAAAIAAEKSLLATAPRRRPWLRIIQHAEQCVGHMERMTRSYLRAFMAETPLLAQRQALEAQQHLDSAAAELGVFSATLDLMTMLLAANRAEEQLVVLLGAAMHEHGAGDLTSLDSTAARTLGKVTASTPLAGYGLGLQFSLHDVVVRLTGDHDRFRRIVADSFRIFSQEPERLATLAKSPEFLPDIQAGLLDLFDASSAATHAIRTAPVSRQAGRALLDVVASLVEGPGQTTAIALLVAAGQKTRLYSKLRQDNATEILRSARTHRALAPLLDGFNLDLRTAQAHRMARVTDEGIGFETRSGEGFADWIDLADEVLTGCEGAMGCLVGMLQALAHAGISFGDANGYRALGISPAGMAAAYFVLQGCDDVAIVEEHTSWEITLTAPPSPQLTELALAASVLTPGAVERLTLRASRQSVLHILEGPVALLKPFSAGDVDGDTYGIATVRMQRAWTHNGAPCIDTAFVRSWTAYQVTQAFSGASSNPVPRLRALRKLALELGDVELADALTAAIRSARLGEEVEQSTTQSMALLMSWGSKSFEYRPV